MAAGTTTFRAESGGTDVAAALQTLGFELGPPRDLTITVLDTFDGRLAGDGLRLVAVRTTGKAGGTRLLLASDGGVDVEVPVPEIPRTPADLPAGPLRARVARSVGERVLLSLLTVRTSAVAGARRDRDGKSTVLAATYRDVVVDAASGTPTPVPGCFVEVTEMAGYRRPGRAVLAAAEDAGWMAGRPRLVDEIAAHVGVALDGTVIAPGIPLAGSDLAIDGYRAVLANLRDAIAANLPGTVDDLDPEFLHDLRVAVRRTRSILANARRVVPAAVLEEARAEFAWLGQITGPARDLDVYQLEWPEYVAGMAPATARALEPVREHLAERRSAEHAALREALVDSRAASLLRWWGNWLDAELGAAELSDRACQPLARVVRRRVRRAHRVLVDHGRGITASSPPEHLHDLRKDAKKLRYLLECFAGLYAPHARKEFVSRLKVLQETLGAHQDAQVHAAHLREVATSLPSVTTTDTLLAVGQLVERLEHRRAARRAEFAERFATFDSRATRHALADLLDTASEDGT